MQGMLLFSDDIVSFGYICVREEEFCFQWVIGDKAKRKATMRKQNGICWIIAICCLLFSCVNRERGEQEDVIDTMDSVRVQDAVRLQPMWTYDYDADTVRYVGGLDSVDLSLEELAQMVNDKYRDKVMLDLVGQQNDTVFVKIDSAIYLTQQMGSAGARDFMAVTTFILTEAKGSEYISFDFKEGDHASPGVYSRKTFAKQ